VTRGDDSTANRINDKEQRHERDDRDQDRCAATPYCED
jgi:hypothetical protein